MSTQTRLGIATTVSMLAKYKSTPKPKHWKMVKNVVRYLIGTSNYGIFLPNRDENTAVLCWSDAEWAPDLLRRRSRTGLIVTIYDGPIIWTSKLQSSTAYQLQTPNLMRLLTPSRNSNGFKSY